MATYKRSAIKRKHAWELTESEFNDIIYSVCMYCGADPVNGIDRIDNEDGYTVENCRPCCKVCNYAKNTMTEMKFKTWVSKVFSRMAAHLW